MMRLRAAVLLPHLLQWRQTGMLLPNSQETRVVHSAAKSPFGAYFSRLYTGSIGRSATAAAVNSIRSVDIPACSGAWLPVSAGQFIRITDIEGQQVADMWAVCAADFSEFLSAAVTRGAGERLFPPVGGAFFSNRYRPLLTLLADKSPGVHDMLWPACDAHLYASFGITGDDVPSCSSNFRKAAAEFGWTPEQVPDPVDWFQNTPVGRGGGGGGGDSGTADPLALSHGPAPSTAGDSVVLRAETDLNVIVTSCAFNVPGHSLNGGRCTPVRLEVVADGALFGV